MDISFSHLGISLGDPLIVAVSGGADSVALLHSLAKSGFKKLVVAHVDHQLRSESSADAEFVHSLAENCGFDFELTVVPVRELANEQKKNEEEMGREERYAFFRQLAARYKARFIVTAHHADDQVETVLLNMIRGAGLEGLAGMKVIDGDLWRPFLSHSKQELTAYCKKMKLKFVLESTNRDLEYRRNFLRRKVIPLFKKLNPNFLGTMENNVRIWSSAADYLQQEAEKTLKTLRIKHHRYDLKKFLNLDEVLQGVVVRLMFEEVHGHKKNLQQSHLDQVLKILRTNVSGKKKEFGAGKVLVRQKTFFEIL
ncbi:MAG: tRNA lysidine(34) synthetase TilS [Candidatus Altimarinota bacterium]